MSCALLLSNECCSRSDVLGRITSSSISQCSYVSSLCVIQLQGFVYVFNGVTQMTSVGQQQLPAFIYQIWPILTSGSVLLSEGE